MATGRHDASNPHEGPIPADHLGREDAEVRSAIRFAVIAAVVGFTFLIVAALWASTCGPGGSVDTVACSRPERTLLGFGAPGILMGTGLWAFARTYRVWRAGGTWWGWQGAGWFLMTLMLVALTMGFPPIAGYGTG
ncbi:MAG TPA: hypothetical protein VFW21_03455 [Mycobacterium sp.]|nr:hypothetical protein [Mycobacterium sp.]